MIQGHAGVAALAVEHVDDRAEVDGRDFHPGELAHSRAVILDLMGQDAGCRIKPTRCGVQSSARENEETLKIIRDHHFCPACGREIGRVQKL